MIRVGTINDGSVPILADLSSGLGELAHIILLQEYEFESPPGYPSRPDYVGAEVPHHPKRVAAGSEIALHGAEANALIQAGAAKADLRYAFFTCHDKVGRRYLFPVSKFIEEVAAELCAELKPRLSAISGGKP